MTEHRLVIQPGDTAIIEAAIPPLVRPVNPGENIAAIARDYDHLLLLGGGNHTPAKLELGGVTIEWAPGAVLSGGGLDISGLSDITLKNFTVRNALRCLWATDVTRLLIDGFDVGKDSANGFYFRGLCTGEIRNGLVQNVNRMVRNDGTNSNNDFGAMAIDAHDTLEGSDIWFHDVRGTKLRVLDTAALVAFNYSAASFDQPAPPISKSFDYGLDEGCFLELWQARGVRLGPNVVLDDVQVIVETGRSVALNGPDCSLKVNGLLAYSGTKPANRVMRGFLLRSATDTLIEHVTLDKPTDWGYGTSPGSPSFSGKLEAEIRNCINISPDAMFRGSRTVNHHHNIAGGTKVFGDFGVTGIGSKAIDPMFVNPTAPAWDYHLKPTSPAIGAGHDGSNIGAL